MLLLKRITVVLLLLAILLIGMLFSIQNSATAPLDLLVIQLSEQKVALWVLLAFAIGGIVGMLISALTIVRLKGDLMLLRRKLAKSDKELDNLRTADLRVPALNHKSSTGDSKKG